MFDSFYDAGIYLRFFIHGPKEMRKLAALDKEKSFAAIQMNLFMKYSAMNEIHKATGQVPKKMFTELAIPKSFRNQILDNIQSWKNFSVFLGNAFKKS
jgi:recombinational DNA repair protein (RecF pathway)